MNKRNYQKELDQITSSVSTSGQTPHLLLHSCCAPCSSYVLEYLTQYFQITDLYYNPNIAPAAEYDKRSDELSRLIERMREDGVLKNEVRFVTTAYDPAVFYETVRVMEDLPEGGERCFKCYALRMEEAARMAAQLGCDYFTTTLSISPLKNAEKINEIGEALSRQYGVKHLPSDFKKRGGYLRSTQLSKEYDLYRQDYCGCVFSKRERDRKAETGR